MKAVHVSFSVCRLLLTEARERVGGNLTSRQNNEGYLWEEGPTSFQPNDAMLKAAVSAVYQCTGTAMSLLLTAQFARK